MRALPKQLAARFAAIVGCLALVAAACSGADEQADPAPAPTSSPSAAAEPTTAPSEPSAEPAPEPTADEAPAPDAPGVSPPVDVPVFDGDDQVLPFDDDVRSGTLDNGLTYYIRRNTAPGGRAELRLAVDAGSSSEDPDQSGVAHFLEHMLFNGTTNYPANELIAVLEAFGSEFGPDVNAYTSYDETVYQLSVPTDDAALFDEALGVLREWASEATIDPAEVDAEIGVVLDEWRLRGQGVSGRVLEVYEDLLTTGTSLEGRIPIGEPDAIEAMSEDVLRRFYEDWYRPDLMAVIVVGDVDVVAVENAIADRFADLQNPDDPRPVPSDDIPVADAFGYRLLADPELPNGFVEVIYPGPAEPVATAGDYRRSVGADLASAIIDERLADDVTRGVAPYLGASVSVTPIARGIATPSLVAQADPAALDDTLRHLLRELERVRSGGFTQEEVDRAVAARLADVEQFYAGRGSRQDTDYAAEYVEHHLGGEASLSWDDWIELERRLLDEMSTDYVQAAYLDSIAGRAPQVVVFGPDTEVDLLPDEAAVLRAFADVAAEQVEARVDDGVVVDSLMPTPDPAELVERSRIDTLDATRLVFANGVTVLIKQTTISEGLFFFQGTSPGGRSILDDDQLTAAFVLSDVIAASGLGDVDQVSLERLLADRIVNYGLFMEETAEVIGGGGATEDAELILQLIHLSITSANATDAALDRVVGELRPFAEAPEELPFLASAIELFDARFGGDPRFTVLPPADELDALTPAGVLDVHRLAFSDSAGAVLTIVGDFDVAVMEDLAARYLGTLPSDGTPDEWVDRQPEAPTGVVTRRVEVGQDPQGDVQVLFVAPADIDQVQEIQLAALENVLATRLRDRLREALGATYSPSILFDVSDEPDRLVETLIEVSGDPDGLDDIVVEVEAIVASVLSDGITDAEAATASEQVRRDNELVTNRFWSERLQRAERRPGEVPLTVRERVDVAAAVDADILDALAALVLSTDDYIVVVRGPEA